MSSSKRFKFSVRSLNGLPAHAESSPSSCAEYTDTEISGLKVQVTKVGRKFFYLRYSFRERKQAIRIGEYPATSLDDARKQALEIKGLLDKGLDPQVRRDQVRAMPTFGEFALNEYLPFALTYKRSAKDDASKLRLYMVPAFGKTRLCDVSTRDVQMYLGGLRSSLSLATLNRHLALLAKLFKLAVMWERIERNPCAGVGKFKEVLAQQRFMSPEEVRRLMVAASEEGNKIAASAIQLLLLTGIRREEALQARWEHVDFDQRTLFLPKTKNGRTRVVLLNDAAVALLRQIARADSPWVFPGRDPSKPLSNARKTFHRILKSAGLEMCRIHDLRHTHASLLVNSGASLYQVQQLLGHASPQTTQRYSHLQADTLRDVSQVVSRIVATPTTD